MLDVVLPLYKLTRFAPVSETPSAKTGVDNGTGHQGGI